MAGFNPGVTVYPAYDPNGILIHGPTPRRIEVVTLASGNNLPAGRLIGKITIGGKYRESLAASNDGSQLYPQCAILLDACDASAADKQCRALITGDFDVSKVSFGTGQSFAAGKEYLAHAGLTGHVSYAVTE
jgi:hypothetical protein